MIECNIFKDSLPAELLFIEIETLLLHLYLGKGCRVRGTEVHLFIGELPDVIADLH